MAATHSLIELTLKFCTSGLLVAAPGSPTTSTDVSTSRDYVSTSRD